MILSNGRLYPTEKQDEILDGLEGQVNRVLAGPPLRLETVVDAFDTLARRLEAGEYDGLLAGLGLEGMEAAVRSAASLFHRESLLYKVETELGRGFGKPVLLAPPGGEKRILRRMLPLGTLFHIAAGNVDGLPAYSVAEGLLTGNINLLKLPQADQGLSVRLLAELIALAPELSGYIHVFDTPSSDVEAMQKLAGLADGIVVWGSDEAVSAVRRLAPPGVKLIEWGHKRGFAYVSPAGAEQEKELRALAEHMVETRQLLCSSCQTVYLDTESREVQDEFCRKFLPLLEQAAACHPTTELGGPAQASLRLYNARLEQLVSGKTDMRIFRGKGCSVTACGDEELELSLMFGNCLVKRLPRRDLLPALRRSQPYLQTAGLLCPPEEREELAGLLLRAGVVRVTRAGEMSGVTCCDTHDGEAPLRRYLRATDTEV